ncbi:MAG: integrase [Gammaproteobacteria bacterium]|nr:integrase [Gammaproteobacteria bacterium]MYH15775.1 integrase [Gammaproteobacteria bacterium]MYK29131.1 integrase [Gammaproteobacteria bacterium]MYK84700.1 integrase [Gammaproteobacteria bacterium]
MTTMIAEVYDAFKSAGAEEDKALAAASAIADYQKDIAELRGDIKLIKWVAGFNLAFSVTMLFLIVRLLGNVAA